MLIKKIFLIVLTIVTLVCFFDLVGCSPVSPATFPEFTVAENNELNVIELSYDGVVYRPYGVVPDKSLRGKQIGIREDDPQSKICEVKGYSSNEWVIEYLDVFMGGGDMLLKAVVITEVPAELEQYKEYEN
jgi:hypothetical protein